MKDKLFIILNIIALIAFCYFGIRYEQPYSEIQLHNNAKVVHETVTVYY